MYLAEAFKALNALNEDTFSLTDDGIKKLSEFEQNDDLTDEISAPVNVGDSVGVARIIVGDEEIGRVNLVSKTTVDKQGYKDIVVKIVDNIPIVK
jgi:hypothetical protein